MIIKIECSMGTDFSFIFSDIYKEEFIELIETNNKEEWINIEKLLSEHGYLAIPLADSRGDAEFIETLEILKALTFDYDLGVIEN